MAIRNIVKEGDEILRKTSRPVEKFDQRLAQLIDDMKQTMAEAEGVGLAAVQVGVLKRVVIVDNGEEVLELVNPRILSTEGEQEGMEGCLSIPGQCGITRRPQKVRVRAQNRFGKEIEAEGEGLTARAFCHEIDHLDGILYKDIAIRMLTQEELRKQNDLPEE